MAIYALNDFLRNTPNTLSKKYLKDKSLLKDFTWTKEQDGETVQIGETEIETLADAIESLPSKDFSTADYDFHSINDMADDTGIQCLIGQGTSPIHKVDLVKEFEDNRVEGYHARAMWVFLNHKDIFEYAFQNQYLDSLSNWKDCEVGADQICNTEDEVKEKFGAEIAKYFKKKRGWGRHCQVDYYHRTQPNRHCFFAYPEDCAKPELTYDSNGKLDRVSRRPVFEIVFMYESDTGLLRVHYPRARNAKPMQKLFCQKILGLKDLPDKNTLVYDLSKLKNKTFRFETEASIERVKLKMLMLDFPNKERVVIEADPEAGKEMALYDRMIDVINAYDINISRVHIKKARMQAIFKPEQGRKAKKLTFRLGVPDSSSLEDKYHDNIIRRHIDEKWGFRRKLLAKTPNKN